MTHQSILHRIAINRTGEPLRKFQQHIKQAGANMISAEKLEQMLGAQLESVDKHNLETIPRLTVLKIVSEPLDINFTFKVTKDEAENYIGAMRQVLSRTRKKAKRKKLRLDEFKMLLVSVNCDNPEYDEVTLIRSKTLSAHEESVLDDLISALEKK